VVTGSGRLVDIGGGRSLYLECVGSGSPTVVLEAGFGGSGRDWAEVQPQLVATTRTCVYDRAGLGNSLPISVVHDASDEITDLQRLLGRAQIAPPYVMVGHSYGGLLVRLFAQAHPDETVGVVLVDSIGPNQTRRDLACRPITSTSSRCAATTSYSAPSTGSRASSSAPSRRLCAPPAATRVFPPASASSPAPAFTVAARQDTREAAT